MTGWRPSRRNVRESIIKMINMAQTNTESVFEFARQIASAKAPSDFTEVWTAQARKQFEMLNEQTRQLTSLGQKMARESTEPIVRNAQQTFDNASRPGRPPSRYDGADVPTPHWGQWQAGVKPIDAPQKPRGERQAGLTCRHWASECQ